MNRDHDVYIKNIEELNKRYYNILEDINEKENDITVEVIEARNDQKSFVIYKEDSRLHLHSRFNPQREAERWISDLEVRKDRIYIVYGIGMIYHIKELINKMDDSIKLLLIEPSLSIFNKIIKNIDITDIIQNKNIEIMIKIMALIPSNVSFLIASQKPSSEFCFFLPICR